MQTKERSNLRVTGKPRQRTDQRPKKESEIEIQYTPAKPFNRNRFLLHLATVAAVVLALVFGMSIFLKVGEIRDAAGSGLKVTVLGAEKYIPWEVCEASGIQAGDALLTLNKAKIIANIREKLPYVGDVRVGIKLPDMVNIEITELEVVYAVEDGNSAWWLLDKTGRIVDKTDAAAAKSYTRLIGVKIQDAVIGQQAVAYEPEGEEGDETETGPTVATAIQMSPSQLLNTGIRIFAALESNGVMGTVDSVDVSDTTALTLMYEERYEVTLGDDTRLEYKIGAMKSSIQEMGQYQSGYLDVSFTIWPDKVGYRPFDGGSLRKN